MHTYHYTGAPAFSSFATHKKQQQLQAISPTIRGMTATSVYFVESLHPLSMIEQVQCMQLLEAEAWDAFSFGAQDPIYTYPMEVDFLATAPFVPPPLKTPGSDSQDTLCLVIPRVGTISPWSSKATDILHNAGLTGVHKVERGVVYALQITQALSAEEQASLVESLHDRMTESLTYDLQEIDSLFTHAPPAEATLIDMLHHGKTALVKANQELGLALSDADIDTLFASFKKLKRNPSDVELMMFAQVNSEHCRHKIFNADWNIEGEKKTHSLFKMIRHTHAQHPGGVLSAYIDNGAVLTGGAPVARFWADPTTKAYAYTEEEAAIVIKVETHNHPTAISPFAGAATGAGGEIRDEGAVGRGAVPKAGFTGFSVSNLHIPGFVQPWEKYYGKPKNMASALEIMLEAPIGAAAYNNEFGRPALCGYFRTYELPMCNSQGAIRGYHKPIMIAGGLGNIRPQLVEKKELPVGTLLIVLGGPAMLIGIGGGAASSMASGAQTEALDFSSVQRGNAEMERRCQEVINCCWAMGAANPILSIHDVGAGGLSNALPELLEGSHRGGKLQLRDIPLAESGLSPLEIWCNEAQERYVLGIAPTDLEEFAALAARERCPFAVVGEATHATDLLLEDSHFENTPVDIPMQVLFGDTPKQLRKAAHLDVPSTPLDLTQIDLMEAAIRVLQLPCVADKTFLVTIGDRTVTGMVARDPMVGPWQVPVADVAVTANSYTGYQGEAMAIGERAPIALLHHAASARMAVGEAITNIAAACIADISDIKLSANWMAAAGYPGEDAGLYDAVQAIGLELCPALGICIPVGKDSLSMHTLWKEAGQKKSVTAPMSLVISAFAPVTDIRKTLTPELKTHLGETDLILIDLGQGNHGLGGSALAQVYRSQGSLPPDLDHPAALKSFFQAIQQLNRENLIAAYHDRSDGGLFVTLCEMAFAGHTGLTISLDALGAHVPLEILFSEELGAVIQVKRADISRVMACLQDYHLEMHSHVIGTCNTEDTLVFSVQGEIVLQAPRIHFQQRWSETSYRMQAMRDNPACAAQAFAQLADAKDPGLNVSIPFDLEENIAAPYLHTQVRPKVAILREQGVNGYMEMAAAFDRAGFTAVDVHMTDILTGKTSLAEFKGLAACGGFSYGDVLGAGRGWAQSILQHATASDAFAAFFARTDTFTLGICNGCQMLSQLTQIIPGTDHWPRFVRNQSEQFEARLILLEIQPSPSIFFQGMAGARIAVPAAHGEGQAVFDTPAEAAAVLQAGQVVARYIDNRGNPTESYPANPNGSPLGIAALTSTDGRATICMPHPERVFRTVQNAWHPDDWQENAPTMRMFQNARVWVG